MSKTQRYSVKAVYYLIVVLSLFLFSYEAIKLFIQYRTQKTGYNKMEKFVDEIEMPAVTICLTEVLKNVDSKTQSQDILQNLTQYTFAKEDIFYDFERFGRGLDVQETFRYNNGLCYTVTTTKKQTKASGRPPLVLYLKKSLKYKVNFFKLRIENQLVHAHWSKNPQFIQKFTFSKYHFSQNSQFSNINFLVISG